MRWSPLSRVRGRAVARRCAYCGRRLRRCSVCDGKWRERNCDNCAMGLCCPSHANYWLVR